MFENDFAGLNLWFANGHEEEADFLSIMMAKSEKQQCLHCCLAPL